MQLTIQWYPRVVNILWRAECRCGKSAVREGSKIRSKAAEHLLAMHSGINIAKFMPPSAFLINQRFFGIFVEYLLPFRLSVANARPIDSDVDLFTRGHNKRQEP